MSKAAEENKRYTEIINNQDFIRLTSEIVNAFSTNGSIWYIPNFDSLNKSNNILPYIQRCFISKNLIKNITKNYEYYEALGDKFLKSALASFIVLRFPNIITPNKISLAYTKYMSSQYQAELSRLFIPNYEKILLVSYPDYNKLSSDLKESLAEDIFEAFCGAIYVWAENSTPCSGILYISNILRKMLDNKGDINEESMESLDIDNISKLTNLLKLLYTLYTQDYKESYAGGTKPTITLTIRFKDQSNNPVSFTTSASSKTMKSAKSQAAEQMIKILEQNNYSESIINKIYNERIKNEKEVIASIKKLLEDKKVKIVKKEKERLTKGRENEDEYISTQPNPTEKTIKVSYNISTPAGNKEIYYIGKDMSRFDALRFLYDQTLNLVSS